MRGTRTLGALTSFVAAFCLTSCSSGANPADVHATSSAFSIDASTPVADPGTGAVTSPSPGAVTSSDHTFNFVVPNGWNLTANPKAKAYLSSATVARNVAPTIVVTTSDAHPTPALDDVVQMGMMKARQDNAVTDKAANRTIGGEAAEGFTADTVEKHVPVHRTYYVTVHDDITYTVTLTSAKDDTGPATSGLNSMLSSWSWSRAGDKDSTASGTTPAQSSTTTSTSTSAAPKSGSSSPTSSTSSPSSTSTAASTSPATASSPTSSATPGSTHASASTTHTAPHPSTSPTK